MSSSRIKVASYLKRIYGALNLPNLQKGLDYTGKILKLTKDINTIAGNSGLGGVKRLTDNLINNKAFEKLEKGVKIGNTITEGLKQNKSSGLFNKNDPNINDEGIRHAYKRHQEQNKYKRVSISPIDEENEANKIINNMR